MSKAKRHRCSKSPCPDEACEHHRTQLEQDLTARVRAILREVPDRHRAIIEGVPWVDVRVVCNGAVPLTAYYCCFKPQHSGQCFSSNKQVWFTPDSTTAAE